MSDDTATGNYIVDDDIDNFPDDVTKAERQAIIDGVEQLVERITKDYFYEKAFDIKLNGNGKKRIYLSIRQKILSVTAVYVNDVLLADTEWDYDEDSVFASPDALFIDPTELEERQKLFSRGHNNIRVVGTLGWTACPLQIKQACIILVRAENDDELYETYHFKSERLGEYSYSRDGKNYTGIPEVDSKIDRYMNRRPTLATY